MSESLCSVGRFVHQSYSSSYVSYVSKLAVPKSTYYLLTKSPDPPSAPFSPKSHCSCPRGILLQRELNTQPDTPSPT